ncbi:MAG: transglutaminaseTgpA domain-containing protein [Acidimicrobiales bacterium]
MALTAAIATAAAAVFTVAGLGGAGAGGVLLPPVAVAVALLPGLFLVATRPERRVLEPGRDLRLLILLTGAGALIWYVTSQNLGTGGLSTTARLAILAVVPLSMLWPAPTVVRYCLLLSAAGIAAAGPSPSQSAWPLAGLAAASALALVALNRQASTPAPSQRSGTQPGRTPVTGVGRRRVAGEATTVLVIAGLAGLVLASLLPPPKSPGRPEPGDEPGGQGATSAYLNPSDRLDAGGKGSGRGNQVLLRITAPAAALWRAQTFDRWDGRSWARSREIERALGGSPGGQAGQFAFVPPGLGDGLFGGDSFVQRVRVEAASAGLLVAAPRAYSLQLARGRVQAAGDGTVRVSPPLGKGATYVVTSVRSQSSDDDLRSDDLGSGVPPEVARAYLQLPGGVPAPVGALAAEITASASTGFDRVKAVEEWLANNTEVAPGSPSLASGADPIEQFLLTDRKGSAEQAASSMAVMLRTLGIPARLAVGFLPGDRYRLGGEFVVRARHGHAWVEAWFPQAGWVAFDPSGRAPGRTEEADSLLDRLRRLLGAFWWVLAVALAVIVRWLTLRAIRRWQRRRARPWVSRCYERLVGAGLRRGRARGRHETPAEYCAALADLVADDRLVEVGRMITRGAYSEGEPPAPDRAWADHVVRETGRRWRRRRPSGSDRTEHLQSVGSSDA